MNEKWLVCGDRNWIDERLVSLTLVRLMQEAGLRPEDITIIDGVARGADTCGFLSGKELGMHSERYPANWDKFGRRAGPIRNQQMLAEGKPTRVLAFHDDIENSKGTKNMVMIARKAGIPTEVFSHDS